jgi:probable phosphoglycerate mutase
MPRNIVLQALNRPGWASFNLLRFSYPQWRGLLGLPVLIDPNLLVFLSRHGQTEFNCANRFCGCSDSALTPRGIAEARRNGRALARKLGVGAPLRIVSSPLKRALDTAAIIQAELGCGGRIETDPRLAEIDFGAWEGLTLAEIESGYPVQWKQRCSNKWTHAPPGGESYQHLADRVGAWLREAHGDMLVVTHGAVDRVLRGLYAGLPPGDICALPEPQDELFQLQGGRVTTI